MAKSRQHVKRWCFTINNPTEDDETKLEHSFSEDKVYYLVVGKEIAPTTGTIHLQGFVHLKIRRTFQYMSKLFAKAHWEAAKGTDQQNQE